MLSCGCLIFGRVFVLNGKVYIRQRCFIFMRKIKTMADVERVQRRNNIILGLVMIFLLTASTAGYSLMSADSEEESVVSEEGFDFVRENGMWKLVIGEDVFGFRNLPSEVADVSVDISAELGMYNGKAVYFVNPGEGVSEILSNIGDYVLRYQETCLGEVVSLENNSFVVPRGECEGDLPVKDCSNNIIVFEVGNETMVYGEGNCVFITGDVLRGSDAFLYKLLGIN